MQYLIIFAIILASGCASKPRQPSSVVTAVPKGALELEQALTQGSMPTVAHLKSLTTAKAYEGLTSRDPAAQLPDSLRAEKYVAPAVTKEKAQQSQFLRKFRSWSFAKKTSKGRELVENFTCENVIETQSLGYSLELDYPAEEAGQLAKELHEKVLTCADYPKNESLFRLAISSIQKGDCVKANEYLAKFPANLDRGVSDRLSYVRSLCSGTKDVAERNPWGGYGILLGDESKEDHEVPAWFLSATSGSEEWDRLLVSFIELYEQERYSTIQYLSTKINFEKFRALPLPFQTSMLVMMSYGGADLPVFQTLHKYLSEHPETISPAVAGLLFPIRFWKEIVDNSKTADPVLVKALIRQESAFNPSARSRARAFGLMQLIYPTARIFGVKQKQELMVPESNITAGSKFLAQLITQFGSVELALAAYNAGPAMVKQWQKRYPTDNIDLFVEMIPYTETREYVRLVSRNYKIYQNLLVKPQILGDVRHPATTPGH